MHLSADELAAVVARLGLRAPVVTPLPGGPLNRTFRLSDAQQDLVLRLAGEGGTALGADRAAELAMLELAATAGLGPPVVLAEPSRGLLVTSRIEGRALSYDDARQPATLARIGGWLARLHALEPPPDIAGIDIAARAASYLASLRAENPASPARELERRLARLRRSLPPPGRLVACHHDLHHLNLVDCGDTLVALDWEYAGPGDPAADLAACVCYHDLDRERSASLLASYGPGARSLADRLAPLCWVFDCLWYGWTGIAATQGAAVDTARRQRLIARLLT